MDDLRFNVILTEVHSYQDGGRLILKGSVQWNPSKTEKTSASCDGKTDISEA